MKKIIDFLLNLFRKKEIVVEIRKCAWCYTPISGAKQKKFCSESCKKKAKYRKQKLEKLKFGSLEEKIES